MSITNDTGIDPSSQSLQNPSANVSPAGGLIIYRTTQQNCETPNRPFLRGTNHITKEVILFQPACKKWGCPYCSEVNMRKWRFRAVNGCLYFASQGLKIDFVTVTSHERLNVAGSIDVMGGAWNKLNRRIKRATDNCEYLLVPEFHKSGKAHLHLLTTAKLKKKFWKDNARSCGFGFQSDVKEVGQLGGVANYVSKYLTKTLQNTNLPKYFRRVRTSAGWPGLPEMPQNTDWHFTLIPRDVALNHEEKAWKNNGYQVIMADGISAWDWIEKGGVI